MENSEKYIAALELFMQGRLSEKDARGLLMWFKSPEADKTLTEYYKKYWDITQVEELPEKEKEKIFQNIRARIADSKPRPRISVGQWLSYAAMFILLISLGFTLYKYKKLESKYAYNSNLKYTVSADKGQRANVVLPDGTKVLLNSHTTLTYDGNYGVDERKVELFGEAYFDVAKDANHRFVVKASDVEIEALGTSFDVNAYADDENVKVALYEGKVRTLIQGRKETILNPNEVLSYNSLTNTTKIVNEDIDYLRMWRNNELAFTKITMGELAVLFDRLYNVKLEFASENVKQYSFSGVIKNNSLNNVIELISLTAPIEYKKEGDVIVLKEKNKIRV